MKLTIPKRFSVLPVVAIVGAMAAVITPQLITPPARADAINNTDFVMTVDTSASVGAPRTFVIPTIGAGHNYNYTVDCNNDGVLEATGLTGNYTCNYATPGTYTIRIGGSFSRIYFNNRGDRLKLRSIDQWGTGKWTSMERAFYGATRLEVKATDTPDLSHANNLAYMFADAAALKGETANWNWDTSTITNMAFAFQGASQFNRPLQWNTARVTNLDSVLAGASAFNQPLDQWNVANVTTAADALSNTGLSTVHYDATLAAWSRQNVRTNVALGATGLTYCAATDQRAQLISAKQWTITGDTKNCQKFTVNFDSQSGSAVASQLVSQGETLAEPPAPVRDGYRFEGWFTDQGFATAWDFANGRMPGRDITLYAKWASVTAPSPQPHMPNQPEVAAPQGQSNKAASTPAAGLLGDTGGAVWIFLAASLGLLGAGAVVLRKVRR